jgi:hypothetical protein
MGNSRRRLTVDLSKSWVLFLVRWSSDGEESPLLRCAEECQRCSAHLRPGFGLSGRTLLWVNTLLYMNKVGLVR